MPRNPNRKLQVPLALDGPGGTAFATLGDFHHAARQSGWTEEEIRAVVTDATSGDYDHLMSVMRSVVNYGEEDDGTDDR